MQYASAGFAGFLVWALAFLILSVSPAQSESMRSQEINQCLKGEIMTWDDGRDRPVRSPLVFSYDHGGAPGWFKDSLVRTLIGRAVSAWSQCGLTGLTAEGSGKTDRQGVIRIQWSDSESRGNFGLANVGKRILSLSPSAFELLRKRNPSYDSRETLQMVISHEMGHFFGLMAHSRRCVDVLSYYDNGTGEHCYSRDPSQMKTVKEYRSALPTACDIERCRMVNGMPPLFQGRLIGP